MQRLMSLVGTCLRGLLITSLIVLGLWVVGTKAGVIPVKQGTTVPNPKREAEGRRLMDAAVAKAISDDVLEGRRAYASLLEKKLSKTGIGAHVGVSGPKGTTLMVRYTLESRLFVYELLKLLSDPSFLEDARKLGFANMHFTNGRDFSGSYDVAKSSWN